MMSHIQSHGEEYSDHVYLRHYEQFHNEYDDSYLTPKQFRKIIGKSMRDNRKGQSVSCEDDIGCILVTQDQINLAGTISEETRENLIRELKERHKDSFNKIPPSGVPPIQFPGAELSIDDGDPKEPPKQKVIRLNESQLFELRVQLKYYLDQGYI